MAENKTKPEKASATAFIRSITDEAKRKDAEQLMKMMQEITDENPVMWGTSIIGFGNVHYAYESGREGDSPIMGFSPRKANFALYVMDGSPKYGPLLGKLGKHKTGKACLYINKLADIDLKVLREIMQLSFSKHSKKK